MPRYYYQCDTCRNVVDEFKAIEDRNKFFPCTKCDGGFMERNIEAECQKTVMKAGENIRNSRSLAMSISDLESGKAFEIHPGATFGKPNRGGKCPMIIHDRREKLKRIKERSKVSGIPLYEM